MKKFFALVVILMMSLVSTNVFAQNEDLSVEQTDEIVAPADTISAGTDANDIVTASDPDPQSVIETVATVANNALGDEKSNPLGIETSVSVPYHKRMKFNAFHMFQEVGLGAFVDKSETSKEKANKLFGGVLSGKGGNDDAEDDIMDKLNSGIGGLGLGANFSYAVVFIPGYREEGSDSIKLNSPGFGFRAGVLSQFDHNKSDGITWDFLLTFGVETGFNKPIGIVVNAMAGCGKTAQTVVDFSGVDFNNPNPEDLEVFSESLFCGKFGLEVMLRSNLLTKRVKNFETALVTRFVYSIIPYNETDRLERIKDDECPVWQYEAWSIGIMAKYKF